ncbi:VWA domain-containing protein [Luteolibacter pohnpeiensis]|uniref:VWA domain-containing protein n=1 Tax=Luteolibacter pohnpeiensis TaxID=454153 RepID=A0A934VVK0_9BACT|nr:VWA domain-containing protein [Luteolibacter pohnpeiensis]MBK1883627.1 VWA domain-containing protein [Luteolibacter pohnpeiensis]
MFKSPEFLLLIPALALLGWFWRGLRLYSPLRALILLVAVIALADPVINKQQNSLDLYVLLDRSDSTEDLIDKGLPEWQRLLESSKPSRRDNLHFINYGAEVVEAGADGSSFTGSRKLTRTGLALSSIAAQADENKPSRVLLFTDGYSTEPITEAALLLKKRGIPLDYRLIREEVENDYRLARLNLPERVQVGEPFLISITVRGKNDATFPLTLSRNGQVLSDGTVSLKNGSATVEFTDRISSSGAYEYQAEIMPEGDKYSGNNKASRYIEITGGPRLLLVTRYQDDPIAKALSALDFSVLTVSDLTKLKPGMLTGMRAVILNNVLANEIPADFMKSLNFFVREQGGGLLMAGGKHSFGSGGYFHSPIDELLPVSMELKNEHRKLSVALAIVMDRSGSMAVNVDSRNTKMDLANAGAANAIELLGPMDQVTVFAVDSEPTAVVRLTTIGNKQDSIGARVRKVRSAGGGIFVYTGLKAAWEELRKSDSGTRHIILFSDANDSEEPGSYKELIAEIVKDGGTVSVIGLGTPTDQDSAFLEDIAKLGGGRIYFSDRPMDIPTIFSQETVTIARSAFLDSPVGTQATGRWAEISPKPFQWSPQVDGYNLSYARPDATVSLVSKDEYNAPLVAHARRGLGRTAAVSFPLGGDFSQTVREWPGYGDFLQTMARFLMGQEIPPGVALRQQLDGTRLTLDLLYDTDEWTQKLAIAPPKVRLQDDTGNTPFDLPWRRISPGHFSLSRDLDEGSVVRGAVQIGEYAIPFGPLSVGSSVEWAFDKDRLGELRTTSRQTGGRELLDLSKAWERPPFIAETNLRLPFSIALLLLLVGEALVTRTGWHLPEFALPKRVPKVKTPKPAKAPKPAKPKFAAPVQKPKDDVTTSESPPDSERRSRFQRAKDRK